MINEIIKIIEDKKAYDITIYDYSNEHPWVDTMIVASCDNIRTVHAIADDIYLTLKKDFQKTVKIEKQKDTKWILIDIDETIVHIFLEDERKFYDVDSLWSHLNTIRDDKNV